MEKKVRAVVYTAIYGNYDNLKQPLVQDIPCDFICFTDNEELKKNSGLWKVVVIEFPPMHPRMKAKYFKLMSHSVFPNGMVGSEKYDYVIWIDGSVEIISPSFAREVCGYVGVNKWALMPHPARDCIYDEAEASTLFSKYDGQPLAEQVASYKADGHPPHFGLWACAIIVRVAELPENLKKLNEAWWEENLRWSYQDQLSLPYLLFKNNIDVDNIPWYLYEYKWFKLVNHNSNE